ncbi:LEAF RUST 10 DISEASE-RESISTANCE LOCUS RECEPTOR-LIKE PROTEIN KINASE-like 1.2 isoform X4 [Phoenix dactylifera]|uniref:non-specific serine/threonine protein kinase n=1 Tax=Phoenix dactylifera TaxID=42345 RepID=A0A8B9ADD4_PHODC|nr:LEAF RUST 10 DISEASE-RESISTANCE LOCUS RECEPTOR-LIKE PROTEIN KINASE-like 1.2 isoform X4 [Phoenix dactylifera]
MSPSYSLLSPILLLMLSLLSKADSSTLFKECAPATSYDCGRNRYNITFPFRPLDGPESCGFPGFELACNKDRSILTINISKKSYQIKSIDYVNRILTIIDPDLTGEGCPRTFTNTIINSSLFSYARLDFNLSFYFNCTLDSFPDGFYKIACPTGGIQLDSYYSLLEQPLQERSNPLGRCSSIGIIPINRTMYDLLLFGKNFGEAMQEGISVTWTVEQGVCEGCQGSGDVYRNAPTVVGNCPDGCREKKSKSWRKIAIGVGAGVGAIIVASLLCLAWYKHRKRKQRSTSSILLGRTASSEPCFKNDPELGKSEYQTTIFTYEELEEATNCFSASKELGDGGFGTVYKGKLRDGRVVAVKRLYEHNYRRVEQFMNEVKILSCLRHQNLVSLYGCTSRHSRELLLVYEYVSNGTVSDHLHGPRAQEGGLTWPIRLSIAIETADALGYLHAVEPQIIHRDVKTNNILLDDSFHVKVADFGLSRLFPLDATHVSTAPQGTPGYVDPEYHQCYQLTDKSDVYSFGVVLAELISSKPAVDTNRTRHEINLANMATTKIQNCQLDQLVDPSLGYQTDWEMKTMITLVAELAFRCLQLEREMRPSIKEALEVLREIESGEYKTKKVVDTDVPAKEDASLLKNILPYSPDAVTERWESRSTTPNTSG